MSRDQTALDELQKRALMTTPVTLVDDEVVIGFDRSRLAGLLGLLS